MYVTARQYGSLPPETTYVQAMDRLFNSASEIVDSHVVDQVLQPLARAIAMK